MDTLLKWFPAIGKQCILDSIKHILRKFHSNFKRFPARKYIWRFHLKNCGHFVLAKMCWLDRSQAGGCLTMDQHFYRLISTAFKNTELVRHETASNRWNHHDADDLQYSPTNMRTFYALFRLVRLNESLFWKRHTTKPPNKLNHCIGLLMTVLSV